MKIYEYKGFPNPARVRIALAEKDLVDRVAFVQVDVPGGAHRKPDFLAINPSGTVPVLELDDGTHISECTAIIEYLDHVKGRPSLTGEGARERAQVHMVQRKIEAGFTDALATYFHQATEGLGPEIEGPQNKSWGERQKALAERTLAWMEGQLDGRPFLAGERFTVADITAMAGFRFAQILGLELPESCPRLRDWHERVSARPSAALAA